MQILALERETRVPPPEVMPALLAAEARQLWALQQQGVVRQAFFRADRKEAVLVVEADSVAQCTDRLAQLPLVQGGFIRFELIVLAPYDGYARLFREEDQT